MTPYEAYLSLLAEKDAAVDVGHVASEAWKRIQGGWHAAKPHLDTAWKAVRSGAGSAGSAVADGARAAGSAAASGARATGEAIGKIPDAVHGTAQMVDDAALISHHAKNLWESHGREIYQRVMPKKPMIELPKDPRTRQFVTYGGIGLGAAGVGAGAMSLMNQDR